MKTAFTSQLQAELAGVTFKCVWFPQKNLSRPELASFLKDIGIVNSGPGQLSYGFFSKEASQEVKDDFLSKTIWCLMYAEGKPIGFVYNVYLGKVAGVPVIHLGLVKINAKLGKEYVKVPYLPLGLGNLLNFGPHYATNISHLPIILESVADIVSDIYPNFERKHSSLKEKYNEVFDLLSKSYIHDVLGYSSDMICKRTYTIRGSMADIAGFETNWDVVPKADGLLCNLFVKDTATFKQHDDGTLHIQDDLIQIGKVDYKVFANAQAIEVYNKLSWRQTNAFVEEYLDNVKLFPMKMGA